MAHKLLRYLRMLHRCRAMPWFTWDTTLPFVVPSWLCRSMIRGIEEA